MKTNIDINIKFGKGNIGYAGAFNSYSIRVVDGIILFAFILKDINGTILSAKSYSILVDNLTQNRDGFWRYLKNNENVTEDLNNPNFVFSYVQNIDIIHANSNGLNHEITLGNFSLLHMSKRVDEEKGKTNSSISYDEASIAAKFNSKKVVHYSFVKKLLEELEANIESGQKK